MDENTVEIPQDDDSMVDSIVEGEQEEGGYLDLNLDDTVELIAYEGEQLLEVADAKIGRKTAESQAYLLVRFELPEHVDALDVTEVLMLPDPSRETAKEVNKRKLRIKRLYDALNLPYNGRINLGELKGMQCYAILRIEESEDYGQQSRIREYIAGA